MSLSEPTSLLTTGNGSDCQPKCTPSASTARAISTLSLTMKFALNSEVIFLSSYAKEYSSWVASPFSLSCTVLTPSFKADLIVSINGCLQRFLSVISVNKRLLNRSLSLMKIQNGKDGLGRQTVPNELFCSKSGEKPLNIAHFVLIFWRLEAF